MRFGSYWKGEWPWPEHMGVGLKLTGSPRDVEELRQFLYGMSCNPVAAERIIKELIASGVKFTTIQPRFNFAHLGDEFQRLGIRMEVVEPVEQDKLNDGMLDSAALGFVLGTPTSPYLTPKEVEEARRRAAETGKLERSQLGPYSDFN